MTGNITALPPHLHEIADGPGVRIGTCGVARTGIQIEIQDDSGRALPAYENGEICVIGPAVFNGYYRNDAANEAAFRNGWFRTGDIGHFDDAGFLYITGRASDMFISGGSNIYPLEIEEKLVACPSVVEACVVGMDDEKWGEIGVAALVLEPGAVLDVPALKATLAERLAGYKIPKRFEVFDALPKSGYGKVTKALVRDALQRRMADGGSSLEAAQ